MTSMTGADIFSTIVKALNEAGIAHMVTGSFASNFYGRPRSTKDADFVVELGERNISDVMTRLGPEFELDPQMSFEGITATQRLRIMHRHTAFMIELFHLSNEPHDQERFRRRRSVDVNGVETCLPTAEDVIVTKLRWSTHQGRSQDLDDARYVMAVQQHTLDWTYLETWCERQGTLSLLEQLRQETRK